MKMITLSPNKIKDIFIFLCTGLLAWVIGSHLGKVNTLGAIVREIFIPSAPFIFLIIVIAITDFSNFKFNDLFSIIKFRIDFPFHYFTIFLGTGIIFGFIILQYAYLGYLVIILFLFVLSSFLAAIILSFKKRPFYGLLIFYGSVPIIVFLERNFGIYKYFSTQTENYLWGLIAVTPMTIFIFTLFLTNLIIKRLQGIKLEKSSFKKQIMVFILVNILTTLIASDNLIKSFNVIISQIFIPLMFYFITINCVKNKEDVEKLLLFLMFSLLGTCFISFYFYAWFGEATIGEARGEIAEQQRGYQLTYALSLIIGFPVCLAFIEIAKNKFIRVGAILGAAFLTLFALIIQFTTAIVSVIAGSFLLVINSSYKKVYVAILVVFLITAISVPFFTVILTTRFENVGIKDLPDYIVTYLWYTRSVGLQGALDMAKDYPLFGVGFGMEGKYNHIYSSPVVFAIVDNFGQRAGETVTYMSSHQLYMGYLTQSGILGFSALLYLLFSIIIIAKKNITHSFGKHDKIINLSLFGVIIGYLTMGLFSSVGFALGVNFLLGGIFWTAVGLTNVMKKLQIQEQSSVSI